MTVEQKPVNTRRIFLKTAPFVAVGAGILACNTLSNPSGVGQSEPGVAQPGEEPTQPTPEKAKAVELTLGPEEAVETGLVHVPDGKVSVLGETVWLTAGQDSYRASLPGQAQGQFAPSGFEKVLSPRRETTEKGYYGYLGITSVHRVDVKSLFAVTHQEFHPGAGQAWPFTAAVGLAISRDNGTTWEDYGTMIESKKGTPVPDVDNPVARGAGQPAAIVVGQDLYVYHIDWSGEGPDSIHLSKMSLNKLGDPQAVQKYSQAGWLPATEGKADPVVSPTTPEMVYTALPSVSYNERLGRYLMTLEAQDGFHIATSSDGVNWTPPQRFFDFPSPQFPIVSGTTWYSYPTFVSPETGDHTKTTQKGYLVYSKGVRNGALHTMVKRTMEFV